MGVGAKFLGWLVRQFVKPLVRVNFGLENALNSITKALTEPFGKSLFVGIWREETEAFQKLTESKAAPRPLSEIAKILTVGNWPDPRRYRVTFTAEYWDLRTATWQEGTFNFYYMKAWKTAAAFESEVMAKFGGEVGSEYRKGGLRGTVFANVQFQYIQRKFGYHNSWMAS